MKWKNCVFIAGVFVLAPAHCGKAQAIMSPSQPLLTQPAWQEFQMQSIQTASNNFEVYYTPPPPPPAPDEPFQSGPWVFRPQLDAQLIYATALLARSNDVEKTAIAQISPGIIVDFNPHWEFTYQPTLRFYSNKQFHNEFDNLFTISGATEYQNWVFGFYQSFSETSEPNLDTGEQTQEEDFLTRWSAAYSFNSKVSMDMLASEDVHITSGFNDSRETTWIGYLNYKASDKTVLGIGGGPGYVSVDIGPDQIYEQLLARIGWHPAPKLFFEANGGMQERETIGDYGIGPTFNPVFGASVTYNVSRSTTISANASRTIVPSYFAGLDNEVTSVGASFSQRFFKKYFVTLSGSYSNNRFAQTVSGADNLRTDDYYTFNTSIGRSFGKRGTISINYQYSDQKSTEPGYSYKGSQFGIELSYRY
ncbi:MAG TPA: outer membrane beta-barrel protein [Verrucomicrobiae bacterium]|nr:outer membrane beta-barrel protein [Verrucomicrobiae bacterium]